MDNNAVSIDIRVGSTVRIQRTWRLPHSGRMGVVLAIEPSDPYGPYIIEFDDGLRFRYHPPEVVHDVRPREIIGVPLL